MPAEYHEITRNEIVKPALKNTITAIRVFQDSERENDWTIESAEFFGIEYGSADQTTASGVEVTVDWAIGPIDGQFYLGAWNPKKDE